ncbi:MAG TPA: cell envelope integrity protein TolA [Ramlibacter sp.]|jgi:colicin import membrane protein|nr:cell envelope integrity protein TolA [Ramlibacter sp.]
MHAAADRPEFAPPPQPGLLRAMVLAVLAHVLLVIALTQGLQWQRETQDAAVEAELWSALPQQAAPPPPVVVPPPPPPQPVVKAPPEPVVKAPPRPEPPAQRDADIALEREKQKRELEKKKLAEDRELQRKKELAEERELQRKKELAAKKREEDLAKKKLEQQKQQQLAEAKRKEDEKRRKEEEAREMKDAQRREQLRKDQIARSLAMAGSGTPSSAGAAAQTSGPSAGWGARVQARVRPNIVFGDDFSGNPEAVIEVRLAPDGTIVSKRVKKSSGNRGWDEAVLRALDKTEVLPRDVDGRVPSGGDLVFRPKG